MDSRRTLDREALQLAAIVDSSEDAIASKDLNSIVQTWNHAAERMFGYTAEDIVGKSILLIIPEERRGEEDYVLGEVRAGRRVEHFETVRRRKDGTLIDVSLSISPIRTPGGEIVGASKIARDITRQKRLEREAFRLAAIVDSSDDAIASKDLNGIVQSWNPAAERMFGYSAEEMIGQPIRRVIPADRQSEEDEVLRRVRAGQSVAHYETVRQRKDGSLFDVSLTVSPIRDHEGVVIGASKIARDISLQRQLARAAEDANRVKDEFLATLSHELRTPLNAVMGYTQMLKMGTLSEERLDKTIEVIERNTHVLSQLVADVLDVSSIVTGKIRLNRAPCDLKSALGAAVDVVRPAADSKEITIAVTCPMEAMPALCDSDRMQQVFWNLLSNAVKFTPRSGQITVELSEKNHFAEVRITDSGAGIRREALPYIFQRFWQGESVDSRHVGGLGLGLALARHFVELHGGTITAASEGEGKGATFTVSLPLER